MNIYIIAGIVIIGLGTLLVYYGSGKNDKESQEEITDKIEDTQRKIEELKSDPTISYKDIMEVENEFTAWADDFLEKKEQKKLELEKTNIGEKETRIELDSFWRPQIDEFLTETNNILSAYSSKSGDSIDFDIPVLPKNIFHVHADPYKANINFRKDIIWQIIIAPAKEHSRNSMVNFEIKIYKDTRDEFDSFTEHLSFLLNPERVQIVTLKNTRFNLKTIPEVSEYSNTILKDIARALIENQLLQLK